MAQTPREWEPSGLVQGYVEELGQRQNPNRFLPLWQEGFPGPHQVEPHRDTAWRGTKPLAMAPLTQALPLACLLLLLLGSAPGADAQAGFELHQPQKEVFVRVGETLTLICTVTAGGPLGPVKWLKGWGSDNKTIYDQKDPSTWGKKAVNGSNTNFTILIRDVRPEDASTYYCVKFRKAATGDDELYRHGDGTVVSVQAKPSKPIVSGPSYRVQPGYTVSFTCNSWGFFPCNISVKWFKDKTPIQSQLRKVTPGPSNFTYRLSSTVTVTLQKDDIRSELTCQVLHTTLTAPLNRSYHLSQILRVPPKVVLEPLGPVGLNETVSFTCDVQGFYPGSVTVTWLENGKEMNTGSTPRPIETPEGLFKLRSTVVVQAVPEKNGSVFTCRVVHEGQDPLSSSATLWVDASGQQGRSSGGAHLLSSPGLWLCMLLDKAILGLVLFFLFKRWQA